MSATVTLAGALQDIGDHLFGLGTGWSEKALRLALVVIVVVKVVQKFSMKAGIGALVGLVVCLGIYGSRTDLGNALKDEVLDHGAASTRVSVTDLGSGSAVPLRSSSEGGAA